MAALRIVLYLKPVAIEFDVATLCRKEAPIRFASWIDVWLEGVGHYWALVDATSCVAT